MSIRPMGLSPAQSVLAGSGAYLPRVGRVGRQNFSQADPNIRRAFQRRGNIMVNPPAVTFGTTFGSTTISGAVTVALSDTRFTLGGLLSGAATTFSSGGKTYYQPYGTLSKENGVGRLGFTTDATAIEIDMFGLQRFNVLVDGQWISPSVIDANTLASKVNGDRYFVKLDFGGRKPEGRRIVVAGRTFQIASVTVGPSDTIWPLDEAAGPKIGVMSDSYGQGISAVLNAGPFWPMCEAMGWRDLYLSPVGGTGYLNNNTTYATFRDRLPDLPSNLDLLLTCGGLNDQGRQTKATLQTETTAYFAAARAASPSAVLVATGPWAPNQTSGATTNYTDVRDAVQAGLATDPGPWVFVDNLTGGYTTSDGVTSTIGGAWQTGTGKVGTTTGTGNGDLYVSSDGTHPSTVGNDYLGAGRLARALAASLGVTA